MNLQIYSTSQLTTDLKETFNRIWSTARNKKENVFAKQEIKPEDLCFFLQNPDSHAIVAGGRYRYITGIKVGEMPWTKPVWGRANISTDPRHQGKGYGKKLVTEMDRYALDRNMWVVGFHGKTTTLSDFYKKCGLEIDSDIGQKMYFPKDNKTKTHTNSNVSYFKGDPLIKKIKKTEEKVYLPYSW